MCSERDSPLKNPRETDSPGRLGAACLSRWLRALASSRSRSAACVTGRDIRDNTSGGPAAQNAAARSHTSELTRGRFCFRVSTGGPGGRHTGEPREFRLARSRQDKRLERAIPLTTHLWFHWLIVNIGSGNGLVPSGNKPLTELMLTQISVTIWCHQARMS